MAQFLLSLRSKYFMDFSTFLCGIIVRFMEEYVHCYHVSAGFLVTDPSPAQRTLTFLFLVLCPSLSFPFESWGPFCRPFRHWARNASFPSCPSAFCGVASAEPQGGGISTPNTCLLLERWGSFPSFPR